MKAILHIVGCFLVVAIFMGTSQSVDAANPPPVVNFSLNNETATTTVGASEALPLSWSAPGSLWCSSWSTPTQPNWPRYGTLPITGAATISAPNIDGTYLYSVSCSSDYGNASTATTTIAITVKNKYKPFSIENSAYVPSGKVLINTPDQVVGGFTVISKNPSTMYGMTFQQYSSRGVYPTSLTGIKIFNQAGTLVATTSAQGYINPFDIAAGTSSYVIMGKIGTDFIEGQTSLLSIRSYTFFDNVEFVWRGYNVYIPMSEMTATFATSSNRAPTISLISGPNNLNVGETGTWKLAGSDPDGDPITYTINWRDSVTYPFSTTSNTLTQSFAAPRLYVPRFSVVDSKGSSTTISTNVQVGVTPGTPTITAITPLSGPAGTQVTLTGTNFATNSFVMLNGLITPITSTSSKIVFTIPATTPVDSYGVSVFNPSLNANSNTVNFSVTAPVVSTCPSVTIASTTYTLSPCTMSESMVDGNGNKNFTATIVQSGPQTPHFYGFSVYGYGEGFPTYSILGVSSGGTFGTSTLPLYFNDSYLTPGQYNGRLPIKVFHGSASSNDPTLYLNINLTVSPSASVPKTPVSTSTSTPPSQPIYSPTACYRVNTLFGFGARGSDVLTLQKFLVSRGFLGPQLVTGTFGVATQAALAKFQVSQNITPAQGYFGVKTQALVNKTCGALPSVTPTPTVTPTATPAATPTPTATIKPTPSAVVTPTATYSPSPTPTPTEYSAVETPYVTPVSTSTPTPETTPQSTATSIPTYTPTNSSSPTVSASGTSAVAAALISFGDLIDSILSW